MLSTLSTGSRSSLLLQILCRYKNIWNIHLQLRPSLIAGIMKDSGKKAEAWGNDSREG